MEASNEIAKKPKLAVWGKKQTAASKRKPKRELTMVNFFDGEAALPTFNASVNQA